MSFDLKSAAKIDGESIKLIKRKETDNFIAIDRDVIFWWGEGDTLSKIGKML